MILTSDLAWARGYAEGLLFGMMYNIMDYFEHPSEEMKSHIIKCINKIKEELKCET